MATQWWKRIFPKHEQCICHEKAKDLCHAEIGRRFRVQCLCGEEKVCERLREMGFCESSIIEKVADSGSLICKVCGTKIIVSKELAQKIIVKDICPCKDHSLGNNIILLSQMTVGQRGIIH
ncbi:MAG: FeoA family protein, partial [Candidatus Omnitrophota bacterium]|nr:FeoA family protein [Candidatus Omnitrophota bacterium]